MYVRSYDSASPCSNRIGLHTFEQIDKIPPHFPSNHHQSRKDTQGEKVARNRESGNRKINFVTTWDPMFPDINKAFRKFYHILEEDQQCKKLFPKGSFRVSYKRGHKNLKELLAPSRVVFENTDALSHSKRQHHGECAKCESCGNQVKGEREAQEFIVVKYWRKIINSKAFRQRNSIELDRTLIVKAKM